MARTTTPGEARRRAAAGFTLIELITVVALIGILAAIALPNYRVAIIQSREAVLKENLYRMRDLIDQYYVDKGQYPPSIETLVEEGYLRTLPEDPFTRVERLDAGLRRARPGPAGGAARRLRRQERLRARLARRHAVQRVVNAVGYSMTRLRSFRLVAAVLLLALAGAGCAAQLAYRQGKEAASERDWDLAVARYTRALDKDQDNIGYQIALETARVQASRMHYDEAKKHLAANDLDKAAAELEIASRYDPANRSASDDLVIVRNRIEAREQEKRERAGLDQLKARAQSAARVPVAVLSPRSPVPITMHFEDASLQKIFESLGRIAGVNVLFDEGFRDKKSSANLTGVSFEEALDRLTFVNRLFYKVLDQNTLIVVPESRQKRVAYDELMLRTFYVQNAEINDTVNLVKTLAKITTVGPNPSLGAITVLGTVDQIAMAERIIEANDKARGEVVVEVQILELNRTRIREWGIDISNYSAMATLSPTGATDEVAGGLLNIRAYLLSSLNQADWVVTLPSSILAKFTESNNLARVLASPRLRAAEGKKAELKIGEEVPIPVTTFGAGTSAGSVGSYIPATSFQYKNVGVNLSLTPRVAASGDITLEFAAEFSIIGGNQNVGSETTRSSCRPS